jgi:pimeloyl-ACP methyl ester carboxylesterase
VRRVFAGKVPLEPLVSWIVQGQLNQPHVHGFIEAMGEHDYIRPQVLERLQMPTRMYWGTDEKMFTEADLAYYSQHIPDVQVFRPEGWGHSPFSERPGEVAETILDFARELEDAG